MPSLLDLPLELLVQIVEETIPVDFEATALSCRTLFAASTPFRVQYATRRKRFRNFSFSRIVQRTPEGAEVSDSDECWDEVTQATGNRILTTRGLLEYIALDPSVAQYIQSIDLRNHWDIEEDEEMIESLHAEVPETLKSLVRTSPFIEVFSGTPEDWIEKIRLSEVHADVFLLTLLSQVQKLNLHSRWDELDRLNNVRSLANQQLWPVLDMITDRANRVKEFPNAPLSMLSVVQPSRDNGYDERSPLTPYVPFLKIDSVCEATLTSCIFIDDGYTGYAFDPSVILCAGKNLRKLTLESCIAGPKELSQLLSSIPNLEIFEFSHETKWHGCGHNWNAGAFLDTVQDACGRTLKELSVTISTLYGGDLGATLVDMTWFQKLAVLELDIDMLCGPAYDPSMRDLEADELDGSPAWPKLSDMLPATIERLNLCLNTFSDNHLKCITHLVEGLPDARVKKLPRLEKLSISVRMDFSPTIPDVALESLNVAKRSGFSILRLGTSITLL
jgi:hypothetical protein